MSCLRLLVIRLLLVSTNQRLLDVQHARSLAGKALRGRQQFSLFSGKFSLTTPPRGSGLPSSAWTGWCLKAVGVPWQLSAAWPSSSGCCLSASYSCCFFTVMYCRQEQIVRIASSSLNFKFKVSSNPLVECRKYLSLSIIVVFILNNSLYKNTVSKNIFKIFFQKSLLKTTMLLCQKTITKLSVFTFKPIILYKTKNIISI